ncbi:unnamed protein product [Cyprideis torosa]|uniref:Uncharacterized protein n=1 Tax=Cyprideis torosa TaxID=163714 RepID=A0A7R8W9G2_9CRUS|nr:unnamed protein product [Cyprideis torosa]CAG0889727.1 unnamed protein product [Cyprideis torosa]
MANAVLCCEGDSASLMTMAAKFHIEIDHEEILQAQAFLNRCDLPDAAQRTFSDLLKVFRGMESLLHLLYTLPVFASEAAWFTVDEAIQILGGMGFMKDCPLERLLRDLRIFRIFEGTNDILRLFIALTGIQHAGLHLRELQAALKNPMGNLGVLLNVVSKRTKDSLGVTSERESAVIENVHPNLHYSALLLAKSVGLFGRAIEGLLRKYGKDIVEKQMHLWRVSNAAIDIVTMAAVLSRSSASLQVVLAGI